MTRPQWGILLWRRKKMIRVTIERKSGRVEIIDRIDLSRWYAEGNQMERFIVANREAAERDPSKGGRVIRIEWIAPVKDDETLAWARVESALGGLEMARERVQEHREDDVGLEYAALGKAEQGLSAAKAEYIATYGTDGAHMVADRDRKAADTARREAEYANSFVARGLD